MKTPLASLVLAALLGAAAASGALAQDKGKIDDVERSADNARRGHDHDHDDDDSGGGGFFFFLLRGLIHSSHHAATVADSGPPAPEPPGQGYLPYPYVGRQEPTSFVMRKVTTGRGFASLSASWFRDEESTLRAAQVAFEGAYDQALFTAEYSFYREPMPDGTDYLHLGHVALSGLGPIGDIGYFKNRG